MMTKAYLIIFFLQNFIAYGVSNEVLNCGACLAVVDEVLQEISKVDPKKLIQVGSYRIDPNGNQKLNQVPYAKSESHLYEVFESVCSKMNNYGHTVHEGRSVLFRKVGHNHKVASGVSVDQARDWPMKLKYACESFLEEHEEDVVESFRSQGEDYQEKLCLDNTDACQTQNVTDLEFIKTKLTYIAPPASPIDTAKDQNGDVKKEDDEEDDDEEDTEQEEGDNEDKVEL